MHPNKCTPGKNTSFYLARCLSSQIHQTVHNSSVAFCCCSFSFFFFFILSNYKQKNKRPKREYRVQAINLRSMGPSKGPVSRILGGTSTSMGRKCTSLFPLHFNCKVAQPLLMNNGNRSQECQQFLWLYHRETSQCFPIMLHLLPIS